MKEVPFQNSRLLIGRGDDCSLRIPASEVSRHHCEVVFDEDEDAVTVKDLGSSNGTFVNGRKVSEEEITPGDTITVGPATFVLRLNGFPKVVDVQAVLTRSRAPSDAPTTQAPMKQTNQKDADDSDIFADFDFSDEGEDKL